MKRTTALVWILCLLFLSACGATNEAKETASMSGEIYNISVNDANGNATTLAAYKGKALLIVNVASNCGYTSQYEGLEKLYQEYKDQGFAIAAFPSNDFGGQEPGTIQEIQEFCTLNYNVTFDLFDKVHATGSDIHPLYKYLTSYASPTGEVAWNFEKFLIDGEGNIVNRYKSSVKPEDQGLIADIEKSLH